MPTSDLCEHIHIGHEGRGREYKAPMRWTDKLTKAKITRTILAMSNIRDGGVIVIGMREESDKQYEPIGLSKSEVATFNHDDIASCAREYADPYVDFTVQTIECGGKTFVIIQVKEFDEVPVICKRDGLDLRRGAIYTRSRTKNESAEVATQSEMREIMDVATEKGIQKFLSKAEHVGFLIRLTSEEPKLMFEKQLEDLP